MDEIFKNNLAMITEQLKISNQLYLDQLKTKDDEIKRLKEEIASNEGRYVDIPQDCSIVKNSVVLDLQKENTELKKENKRLLDEYVYKPDKEKDDLVEQIKVNTDDLQLLEGIIKELKEKVKSYEDNVDAVGMTMIEKLTEESGIKEERIMSCEKLCSQYGRDLKFYRFMFEDLLLEYIRVSQSSDNPIYEEPLILMRDACRTMGDEEQLRIIELIKRRIDNMNSNDWNEDGGLCKLTLTESHRLPSNYVNDRFMVYIETQVEEDLSSDSDSDSSDEDSSDDEDLAEDDWKVPGYITATPQGNSN